LAAKRNFDRKAEPLIEVNGVGQGSQTQICVRATFKRKIASQAAVYQKKALAGHNLQEKLSKYAKFDQNLQYFQFLRCLRAAQMHLAGHMRPAGRVFETPGVGHKRDILREKREWRSKKKLDNFLLIVGS
jgi:hypothetical protein